jgi:hypothetical protein
MLVILHSTDPESKVKVIDVCDIQLADNILKLDDAFLMYITQTFN